MSPKFTEYKEDVLLTHVLRRLQAPLSCPVVHVSVPRSPARSFMQHGLMDTLVTVGTDGSLGVHGWLPYDRTRSYPNYFTFERDPALLNAKSVLSPLCRPSPVRLDSRDCRVFRSYLRDFTARLRACFAFRVGFGPSKFSRSLALW